MTLTSCSIRLVAGACVLAAALAAPRPVSACTNLLVSRGATADGSTMITYTADSHELYGELYFRPEGKYPAGTMMDVVEWDTGKPLGKIPQAAQTYRVVGNMNEYQVAIGETTFGGRKTLVNPKGGIDYGSMIYVSLQRSKTAREAIQVLVQLAEENGYRSEGESFSIADPNEIWLMEMVGKGPDSKGIVWVAMRVPEGYVGAHANQSRIRKFPLNDPDNCLFAKDVISFAREKGFFKGKDDDFSFADAYAPADCKTIRACDGRVWNFYHRVAPSQNIPSDYIKCKPGAGPLPLWVKPEKKLSPRDMIKLMRDHYEDTEFDMRNDIGAGPYALPYRWRPMHWTIDGKTYVHERAVATQQTAFSFVTQSRSFLPNPVGGVLWFSVDDASSTVYVPMYNGIRKVPKSYAVGNGSFTKYSPDAAFWVFNQVANQVYGRYSEMIVDVQKVQSQFEDEFFAEQARIEEKAVAAFKTSPRAAEEMLTKYSVDAADRVVGRWSLLWQELLVKYLDGNVRDEKGKITHPPYPEAWYRRIIKETGDRYFVEIAASASASASASAPPALPSSASAAASAAPPAPRPASRCSASVQSQQGQALALVGVTALAVGLLRRKRRV